MAAGTIITVLSNIPWGQVMDNAPKLAEGAARLWKAVTRSKPGTNSDAGVKAASGAVQSDADVVTQRVAAMEEHILRLEEQMGASAELIKALAEQNTQLVSRIELNRVRLLRVATGAAIGFVALGAAVVALLLRP